jgi:hypothetical protein
MAGSSAGRPTSEVTQPPEVRRAMGRPILVVSGDARLGEAATAVVAGTGAPVWRVDPFSAEWAPWAERPADWAEWAADPAVAPSAVVVGADVAAPARQTITRLWPGVPVYGAAIGVGAGTAEPAATDFVLPGGAAGLLQLLESAVAPRRRGWRVAVVAASGGLGASTLALALARQHSQVPGATLIDLNPAGAPLASLVGLVAQGPGWGELLAEAPAGGVAARPLGPRAQTGRGGAPDGIAVLAGSRAIAPGIPPADLRWVVEAVERGRPGATTVFDASAVSPVPLRRLAGWCDHVVILARSDPDGRLALEPLAQAVTAAGCTLTVVARPGRGGLDGRALAGIAPRCRVELLRQARHPGLRGAVPPCVEKTAHRIVEQEADGPLVHPPAWRPGDGRPLGSPRHCTAAEAPGLRPRGGGGRAGDAGCAGTLEGSGEAEGAGEAGGTGSTTRAGVRHRRASHRTPARGRDVTWPEPDPRSARTEELPPTGAAGGGAGGRGEAGGGAGGACAGTGAVATASAWAETQAAGPDEAFVLRPRLKPMAWRQRRRLRPPAEELGGWDGPLW